jgi:hypothetical protein
MSDFAIRDILSQISNGNLRIPTFQRGFVWDADSVAFLMDSIYKKYPFGTIQLWRTKEILETEKNFGPFQLFDRDAEYPIDYVLDGQQRITSIFGVFQTDIQLPEGEENPFSVYFDLEADDNAQESQFLALKPEQIIENQHFPLNCLFDTVKYRQNTRNLSDQVAEKIDKLQSVFKEVKIPYQTLETDDKSKVAIVFERINRKGIPLDTLQLLTAWTWSEEFDLQDKFEDLQEELRPYGFHDIGNNANLLLRVASSVLSDNASAKSLIELNGGIVRERFSEITNGIKGAIDFLKSNLKIERLSNLPYDNMLVPLSVFFANTGNQHFNYSNDQRKKIIRWFWITAFTKRYSAGVLRALNRDIDEMNKLKNDVNSSSIDNLNFSITSDYFTDNDFTMGTVNTKSFVLLLAQNSPRSFISGSLITLSEVLKEYNRNEFHHIYPKAFLLPQEDSLNFSINCLANFCFLSRSDNKKIGGIAPSKYRDFLPNSIEEIMISDFCSEDELIADDFDKFITTRSQRLKEYLDTLIQI